MKRTSSQPINRGGGSFDSARRAEREHGKVPVPVSPPSGTGGWVRGVARAAALAIFRGRKRGVDRSTTGRCGEELHCNFKPTNVTHPRKIARGGDAQRPSPWRPRSCWGTSGYVHTRTSESGPSLDPRLTTGGPGGGPTEGSTKGPYFSGPCGVNSLVSQPSSLRLFHHTTTPSMPVCHQGRRSTIRRGVDFHISFPMTTMAKSSSSSSKPVKVFRLRGVSASVFENSSEQNGTFHKVQIVRTYKDGEEFKTTPTFNRDDLPFVQQVAHRAWEFVHETEAGQRSSRDDD